MVHFKNKVLSNNYIYFFLLFSLSCLIKWFYLAYRNYYITFSDTLVPAYVSTRQFAIMQLLKKLFIDCNYYCLGDSSRPFVTALLYVFGFKLIGLYPHTLFLLNIFFSSLLIPLYYLIIRKLLGAAVALFSSLSLTFLPNYIQQGLNLTGQMTGVIFLALSFLFAVNYYQRGQYHRLYLSGFFLTLSNLCRYEYILFVPFFVLYNLIFDKKIRIYTRVMYCLICLSGIIYLCLGNFNFYGDPFAIIHIQNINANNDGIPKLGFLKANLRLWDTLSMFAGRLVLMMGIGGVYFVAKKDKALPLIFPFLVFLGFLLYKLANGTMYAGQDYFFILFLFIIPMAFWFLRTISLINAKDNVYLYISLAVMAGLLIYQFHKSNLFIEDNRLGYPQRLIRLTEDLKNIPCNYPLYVFSDYGFISAPEGQAMLFYLKRNPAGYLCNFEGKIKEKNFYFLIPEEKALKIIGKKEKLRDYNYLGYKGLSLYKIAGLEDNSVTLLNDENK